ncbi:hypothetical protein KKC91_10860 [bacterium]|nr:hypothetical protein [bacterium]
MQVDNNSIVAIRSECRFCSYLRGKDNRREIDTPWLENGQYVAMTSIGGFVPGWSLICPVEHTLNLSRDYCYSPLWLFTGQAIEIVSKRYGEVRIFEHGSQSSKSKTSCGTAHAHLHIVPLSFSLENESVNYGEEFQLEWQQCYATDIKNISGHNEYLFVADEYSGVKTKGQLAVLSQEISQFFRKVIANKLGVYDQYNYRANPMMEVTSKSARQLREDALIKQYAKVGNF